MQQLPQNRMLNNLLRLMPPEGFDLLRPHLEAVALPVLFKLAEASRPCSFIYFPSSGVASVMGRTGATWQEVGVFGHEGAGCCAMLLGTDRTPFSIIMQVAGTGFRVPTATIQLLARHCDPLRGVLLRYIHSVMIQISQSSLANTQLNIGQRLARWILMIQDRVGGDFVALTHELLAEMLGVGRTGVTLALHDLQRDGLISMTRKRINILDRTRLEAISANFYGIAEAEYTRLIGPLVRAPAPFLP